MTIPVTLKAVVDSLSFGGLIVCDGFKRWTERSSVILQLQLNVYRSFVGESTITFKKTTRM